MAITGTGIKEDPFVVHTALELRTALGEANAYVKLDNDIANDLRAKDMLHESQGALIIKMKRTGQ